jgi:hypothetical protein
MAIFVKKEDLVEVEVEEVKWDRPKSLIVVFDGEEILIPKSQIGETSEVWAEGDSGTLVIPRWLARDRGML